MATIKENAERIKAAADDIREVIDLCYAPVGEDERIETYAPKLAKLAVDEPTLQTIGVGGRVTAEGADIKDGLAVVDKVYGETTKFNQLLLNKMRFAQIQSVDHCISAEQASSTYDAEKREGIISFTQVNNFRFRIYNEFKLNHRYIAVYKAKAEKISGYNPVWAGGINGCFDYNNFTDTYKTFGFVFVATSDSQMVVCYTGDSTVLNGSKVYLKDYMLFDLTAMGWESVNTPEQFAQRMGYASIDDLPYFEYTEGALVSSKGKKIVSKSRNYLRDDSILHTSNSRFEYNNGFIKKGNYTLSIDSDILVSSIYLKFFEVNGIAIESTDKIASRIKGATFGTSSTKEWFYVILGAGTTITFSILRDCFISIKTNRNSLNARCCISPEGFESYVPIFESSISLDLTTILDENGEQVFPNGLLSAEGCCDEIDYTRNVAIKRLGRETLKYMINNRSVGVHLDYSTGDFMCFSIRGFGNMEEYKYGTRCAISDLFVKTQKNQQNLNNQFAYAINFHVHPNYSNFLYFNIPHNVLGTSPSSTSSESIAKIREWANAVDADIIFELLEPIEFPLPKRKTFYRVSNGGTEKITSDGVTLPLKADIAYRMADAAAMAQELSNVNDLL